MRPVEDRLAKLNDAPDHSSPTNEAATFKGLYTARPAFGNPIFRTFQNPGKTSLARIPKLAVLIAAGLIGPGEEFGP